MSSAHFSVSLQLSMVPVWSDKEIPNSYCVLIDELSPGCICTDVAHSGFEHKSLRRATLWLHTALEKEIQQRLVKMIAGPRRSKTHGYCAGFRLKTFFTVGAQLVHWVAGYKFIRPGVFSHFFQRRQTNRWRSEFKATAGKHYREDSTERRRNVHGRRPPVAFSRVSFARIHLSENFKRPHLVQPLGYFQLTVRS